MMGMGDCLPGFSLGMLIGMCLAVALGCIGTFIFMGWR